MAESSQNQLEPAGDREVSQPSASCYIGPEGFKMKIPPANSRMLVDQKSYSTPGPFIDGKTLLGIDAEHKALGVTLKVGIRSHGPVQILRRRKRDQTARTSESWNTVIHDRWSNQVRNRAESETNLLSWLTSFSPDEDPLFFSVFFVLGLLMIGMLFVYVYLIMELIHRTHGTSAHTAVAKFLGS